MGTIRFRLTMWYAGLFLLAGFMLLSLNFALASQTFPPAEDPALRQRVANRIGFPSLAHPGGELGFRQGPGDPMRGLGFDRLVAETREELRLETLRRLLVQSTLALALMATASVGAGWLIAGRMLRPVSDITSTVGRISAGRLHERVALGGPRDELRELADQFDAMLDRLDVAFQAQQDFVANASHELRTPLAVIRAELDVSLRRPDVTQAQARESAEVIARATERAESLIAALLTLARADGPLEATVTVDLADVVDSVLAQAVPRAEAADIRIERALAPATVRGDRVLIERMVENLVANAIAYNVPGGSLRVDLNEGGDVTLRIANTGEAIDPASVNRLFDRFQRLESSRSRESGGYGLGLAIVRAVARHHGGEATGSALPGGGLEVVVRLPGCR